MKDAGQNLGITFPFVGNVASPNPSGAVTPNSKLAPKTPTYAPSVSMQENEDFDMDFGVENFDLGGPDETYDPPQVSASDSAPIIAATPTRLNSYASYRESMQVILNKFSLEVRNNRNISLLVEIHRRGRKPGR